MTEFDTDLFVIGGGSGGVRAARIASQLGAKVILAEEYRIGGTCVIRGCVPKKLLVYASKVQQDIADASGFGWTIPAARFTWSTLKKNVETELDRLEAAYANTLDKAGVRVVRHRAKLKDKHTLILSNGEIVRSKYILVATGGTPNGGKIPGIEHTISSNEVFQLPEQPETILIHGGGYIALEFAGIFAGLGSKVILVHRGENILRGFDEDIRHHVRDEIERSGIQVISHRTVTRVDAGAGYFVSRLSDGSEITSNQVLLAIGRQPCITNLGLEDVGVAIDPATGGIAVDEHAQTSVSNIFAVGDVTHRFNLTPVAIREGQAFAQNVFGNLSTHVDYADIPTAVFSQPEVGTVGLTEAQAKETLTRVDVYKTQFRPMKFAFSGRPGRTTMKLVVDGTTNRVVGCHIVGENAGELIQAIGIAVKFKATKEQFDATMAVHPTAAEELVTMSKPVASYTSIVARQ